VLLVTVPTTSQAAADGFQNYDVILQFADHKVVSLDDLTRLDAATAAGTSVVVGVHRDQQDTTVELTK
jgi:S1-C subfamily serine protease